MMRNLALETRVHTRFEGNKKNDCKRSRDSERSEKGNTNCHVFWNADAMLRTKRDHTRVSLTVTFARQMAMAGWESAGDRNSERAISQ